MNTLAPYIMTALIYHPGRLLYLRAASTAAERGR